MLKYFKSEKGKKAILALYQEKLSELEQAWDCTIHSEQVESDWGSCNVLVCGKVGAPPILLLHGSNAMAPIALESFPELRKHFRVYALDIPAQPNRSEAERPNMKDDSYGRLVHQVIEHFQLDGLSLLGFSWGGLVALKAAAYNSAPIKALYLAAPAYIVNGNPLKLMFKMFLPLRSYIKKPDPAKLQIFLDFLFSDPDAFAPRFLDVVFRHFELDFDPVPKIGAKEAASIKSPIYLFGGADDQIFPGKKMIKRAHRIFPSLKQAELLEAKHVFADSHNRRVEEVILAQLYDRR